MKRIWKLITSMIVISLVTFAPVFVQAYGVKDSAENSDYNIKINNINEKYYSGNISRKNKKSS
ncbi:hypothetical protein [Clostridium carboxidivorans]|uniref:hypothetical protein n=1 Tax=Clostridium carboxidivorans TaxID=217159 RepID=UPI00055914A2|nr:hypothetical protein [Clostridium carboxidivorans]